MPQREAREALASPPQLQRAEPVKPLLGRPVAVAGPLDDVVKTILAEAAGEGPEGMYAVASVINNRARRRGKTPQQIVNEPYQFAGRARPDLDRFVELQRPEIQQAATDAWMRALQQPIPDVDHFLSNDLANSPRRPQWSTKMRPITTIGNHTFYSSQPDRRPP